MTDRESMVLDAITQYIEVNGISPSIRDLCEMTEINSTSSVLCILNDLSECGYIQIEKGKKRTIRLTDERKISMRIKLDEGAYLPTRAHPTDAGMDLYARETKVVPARGSAIFDTGVHIELPYGTVGMLKSKSGLNVNQDISSEGVIDVGYTGSIVAKLYNHGDKDYTVMKGDKITQLVIMPYIAPDIEVVDELEASDRGDNGFGSSGR